MNTYVEAELYVQERDSPSGPRPFMFGHPTLCHISPREAAKKGEPLMCDFLVTNCEVGDSPHGYTVRVYLDDHVHSELKEVTAHMISADDLDGLDTTEIKMVLVNPAGEEMQGSNYALWSYEGQKVSLV